jgi:cytochrome b
MLPISKHSSADYNMHGTDTGSTSTIPVGKPVKTATVWDLPLRVFHWSMVCVVALAALTGYFTPEWWLDIHVYAGYAIGTLLAFRLMWGFWGTYYSRFRNFPLKYSAVSGHVASLLKARSKSFTGHNPVGAWMIVILLTLLISLVMTGLVVLGGQENLGPLASVISFQVGDFTEDIHEILSGLLMAAICIHLLGVIVEVNVFRHPILKAMITGKKPVATDHPDQNVSGIVRGSVLFLLVIGGLFFMGLRLSAQPSEKWQAIEVLEIYKSECGDCHHSYHPSLLSANRWDAVMSNLSDHYGEDASLDEETRFSINSYLNTHDAFRFDTEISHKIGRKVPESGRMTDTRFWKKRHQEIDKTVFKSPLVGSKVNCGACHGDAESGKFDDAKIHLPNGDKK